MRNKHRNAQRSQDSMAYQDESNTPGGRPSFHQRLSNNPTFQRALRVLQFLSAIISLGLFTSRLHRILQYAHRASASNGAVEGILVAAVLYTIISTILRFVLRSRKVPGILRWLWLLLDLLFIGAFIAVAYLTSPGGNKSSGPCHKVAGVSIEPKGSNCNLPYGTFVLAIVSILLHALSAIFHSAKNSYQKRKHGRETVENREMHNQNSINNEQGPGYKQEPGYGKETGLFGHGHGQQQAVANNNTGPLS